MDATKGFTFFLGGENVELLKEIEDFRIRIWSEKIGLTKARERFSLDKHDYNTMYCVKCDNDNIVGFGGLTVANRCEELRDLCSYHPYVEHMSYPLAILSRRVVGKHFRSKDIGKELILARVQKAQELEMKQVWGEILQEYKTFLIKNGFEDQGQSADKSIVGDWRIMAKDIVNN